MPCTWPKASDTAAIPASTPVATGSIATASARSEAKASQSSTTIVTVPQIASRSTSLLIRSRAATPKLPAPESTTRSVASASTFASGRCACWLKALPTAFSASCWPSRSLPSARVVSTSTARGALRETQTPFSLLGACAGVSASTIRTVSPVGSRSRIGLISEPAGVPRSESVSSIAARTPSTSKRAASTAGLRA